METVCRLELKAAGIIGGVEEVVEAGVEQFDEESFLAHVEGRELVEADDERSEQPEDQIEQRDDVRNVTFGLRTLFLPKERTSSTAGRGDDLGWEKVSVLKGADQNKGQQCALVHPQ